MTANEFNKKWTSHIEPGFEKQGLEFDDPYLTQLIDNTFTVLKEVGLAFSYSQIKQKFGYARVYLDGSPMVENASKYLESVITQYWRQQEKVA